MSRTVDDRVVSMQFDNKHFERNVQTSLGTIDKLKNSLKFTGATKGLEDVDNASRKVNLNPLSNAAEGVKVKFSALQVIATTALANITNSAVEAGKRITAALTTDAIKAGFSEYETQIGAIQTIMANTQSKGTTLEQVNAALDELNLYADKTIYNFTEMTRNIGTFTAAGVDLDTSVAAIKGIANLAAVSGSTSQQASTAMYQLSQALASGTVKLMDWNSVVNAGMGGQVFQDALKETARLHGIAIDDMIESEGSFRETLSDGWLSSEILTETLKKFTGDLTAEQLKSMGYTQKQVEEILKLGKTANDAATKVKTFTQLMDTLKEAAQSGWAQTWRILVGDFEQAKELWSGVSDVFSEIIGKSAELRNVRLEEWAKGGGRDALIESFKNLFNAIVSIVKPVKEAFNEIFPPTTAKQLLKITEAIKEFTSKLILSEKTQAKLKSTFKGLFAVIDIGVTIIKEVVSGIAKLLWNLTDLGKGVVNVTGSLGDWLVGLRDSIKESGFFKKVIGGIVDVLQSVIDKVKQVTKAVSEKVKTSGFDTLVSVLKNVWNIIKTIAKSIGDMLGEIFKGLGEAIANGDVKAILDIFNTGVVAAILIGIKKLVDGIKKPIDAIGDIVGFFNKAGDGIIGLLTGLGDVLKAWQLKIQADALMKIAAAIGILTLSIVVLAAMDTEKVSSAVAAMALIFVELMGAMAVFAKISNGIKGVFTSVVAMIGMSTAVLLLAFALKTISDINPDDMISGILGIGALAGIVVGVAKALSSGSKAIMKGMTSLIAFALAIKMLASTVKYLSALSWEELAKGLTGVVALMGTITGVVRLLPNGKKLISTSISIVILAAAMKILASACHDFSTMDWEEIARSITALSLSLGAIILVMKTLPGDDVLRKSVGLTIISASLLILASALNKMGSMSWEETARSVGMLYATLFIVNDAIKALPSEKLLPKVIGATIVSVALVILAEALDRMGNMSLGGVVKAAALLYTSLYTINTALEALPEKDLLRKVSSLTILSVAVSILASAFSKLGEMSWAEVAKASLSLAAALGSLVGALHLLPKDVVKKAASIMVLSAALTAIAIPIKLLGGMSLGELAIGLIGIAAAFGLLALAGKLMAPALGSIMKVAASIALLGVAVAGIGFGIAAIGSGVAMLAKSFLAFCEGLIKGLYVLLKGVLGLLPLIINVARELLLALCDLLIDCLPALTKALIALVNSLVDVLVECVPKIADEALKMILGVLQALSKYSTDIVEYLFDFLIKIIDALSIKAPELVEALVNFFANVLSGFFDALRSLDSGIFVKALAGMGTMYAIMWGFGKMRGMLAAAAQGILEATGTIALIGGMLAALGALAAIPGVEWLMQKGGDFLQWIAVAIGQVIGGIIGGIQKGMSSVLPSVGKYLAEFMDNARPFFDVIKHIDGSTLEGVKMLAEGIRILATTNISKLTDYSQDFVTFGKTIAAFSETISGKIDEGAVIAAANAGRAIAEMAATIPNSGGIASWFAGENDLATFTASIVPFGRAMADFSTAVSGKIDEGAVMSAANAGKVISEMAAAIPNKGGLGILFVGDNNFEEFCTKIVPFGKAMAAFSAEVSGKIDEGAVSGAANGGKALAEMAATIPNSGGIISWFAGQNELDDFAEKIVPFGAAMALFSGAVSGNIDEGAVTAAACAGKALAEMNAALPETGGLRALFAGQEDMKKFSSNLEPFGQAMVKFSKAITGKIDEGAVVAAANAGKAFAEMSNISPESLTTAVEQIDKLVKMAKGMIDVDFSGLSSFGKALTEVGTVGVTKFVEAFENSHEQVQAAVDGMLDGSLAGKEDSYGAFYDAGVYMVKGFAKGITDTTYLATAKATAMANAAKRAAAAALDEHSPSKEFYDIGAYAGEGLVIAFEDYEKKSFDAGYGIGDNARIGLSNAVSKIADVIDSDMDTQPTIRPVLDLSEVESGARNIGGLFDTEQSVGVLAKVNSINTAMNKRQSGNDNSEVVSAIDGLGKRLENSQGDSYVINGLTYDDSGNIYRLVEEIIRMARVERRI